MPEESSITGSPTTLLDLESRRAALPASAFMSAADFEALSVQSLMSPQSDFGIILAPQVPWSWADESQNTTAQKPPAGVRAESHHHRSTGLIDLGNH